MTNMSGQSPILTALSRATLGCAAKVLCALLLITTTFTGATATGIPAPNSKLLFPHCKNHRCIGYDVVIYGSTPAAIAAALQTVRMNRTVAIVTPDAHIGGLTTSGLGWTDSKNGDAIGGISREFYEKVYQYYLSDSAWTQESRAAYIAKNIGAQPGPAIDTAKKVQWTFEPHVAEAIFEKWMRDARVPIYRNHKIIRDSRVGAIKAGTDILLITTEAGGYFIGSMFIDASYEGDLMATAKIPYRVGREASSQFGESFAGTRFDLTESAYGSIDPYVQKGEPASGLLPGILREIERSEAISGQADPNRLQSYNFRVSLTKQAAIKKPFFKPANYDEAQYELLFRYIESGYSGPFFTDQLMPNGKTDTNANGKVSTDLLGGNYNNYSTYADDSYEQRAAISETHKTYAQGFFWSLANHPRVPQTIRDAVGQYGYVNDEWASTGNWPYSIYIRETRRMQGVFTMTQSEVQNPRQFPGDSVIGLGCYSLDSHQVERVVVDDHIYDEGLVHEANPVPYGIAFGSILAQPSHATNFLNPVTLSSSHVAFASMRMEPVYMILGQSAATAAVMALEQGVDIQDVDRAKLTARLQADGQLLVF